MTSDTLKSLGYLKKSLKMTKRALEKNKADDNADVDDLAEINYQIDGLIKQINAFEAVNPNPIVTPSSSTAINPTSIPSTIDDGNGDDLLTT